MLSRFFNIWPYWPRMNLASTTIIFLFAIKVTYIPNKRSVQVYLFEISCLQAFQYLTLFTPNDLWILPKLIVFLYSMGYSDTPNMRCVQPSLLETLCLHHNEKQTIWQLQIIVCETSGCSLENSITNNLPFLLHFCSKSNQVNELWHGCFDWDIYLLLPD